MSTRRLIVVGPVPPPYHGVTVSTSLVLANPYLQELFKVEHLDTSDPRPTSTIGAWDFRNIQLGLVHARRLLATLGPPQGLLYVPLSQGVGGFLRDSLFIHEGAAKGWRVAGHLRGGEFLDFYGGVQPILRRWIRFTLARLSAVGVMGSRLRWLFSGFVPRSRIAVIPNGSPDVFAGDPPGPRGKTVVFPANLWRRKGLFESLEAAQRVLGVVPDARFAFVGDWESDDVREAALRLAAPLGQHVQFTRAETEAERKQLLSQCAVVLFPPNGQEGHPRVVLEAMTAGLPVVTTDRGALADTVLDGVTGFVLPQSEPQVLADRVAMLLENEVMRLEMGAAGRARYLDHFTEDRADRLLADWLRGVAA